MIESFSYRLMNNELRMSALEACCSKVKKNLHSNECLEGGLVYSNWKS